MSFFIESSERINAANILSQLRMQKPTSKTAFDKPQDSSKVESSMVECANLLLATRQANTSDLHPLMSRDFLHKTVKFKRPHITLGSAFQPPELGKASTSSDDGSFGLAGPVTKKFKRDVPLSCATHNPYVARKEDYALDVGRDLTSYSVLPMGSESSLLSPPMSPQFEDSFVQEPVKEKSFSAKRPRRESECSGASARPKKEDRPEPRPVVMALSRNRECISCHITQTPCWRPSWDPTIGQLCNSCGLRYRKTQIRCSSAKCANVPSKLDLAAIRAQCRGSHLQCPKCTALLIKD